MSNYSTADVQVTYRWRGIEVTTTVRVPHSAAGDELVRFIGAVIDEMAEAQARAEAERFAARSQRTPSGAVQVGGVG